MDSAPPRDVCPHCKRETWAYRFESPDGVRVESHRCREHGDVVPMQQLTPYLRRRGWPMATLCGLLLGWALLASRMAKTL